MRGVISFQLFHSVPLNHQDGAKLRHPEPVAEAGHLRRHVIRLQRAFDIRPPALILLGRQRRRRRGTRHQGRNQRYRSHLYSHRILGTSKASASRFSSPRTASH